MRIGCSSLALGTLALVLLAASFVAVPVAAEKASLSTEQVGIALVIINAAYTDADGDLLKDDIVGWFDILLSGAERYTLNLRITLRIPSGLTYAYLYLVSTRLQTLHCTMYFYDHATESGDYVFGVEATLYNSGGCYQAVEYTFDPPGGSGNADPCGVLVVTA